MSLRDFAQRELELAGFFDKDSDYEGALGPAVMRLVDIFAEEGHSGFSAGIAINLFNRVARFEPLTPLTGEDHEWQEVTDDLWQNLRCFHVFKTSKGAYDSEGRIFREPNGACFTSRDSRVPVTFPYVPKSEYVDVEK